MDKKMEEAMIQTAQMHFKVFQEFMKLTGNKIGLSLQLASSWTAGIAQAGNANGEKEKAEKFWDMINGSGGMAS